MLYAERIFRIQNKMCESGVDVLILSQSSDLYYLTGIMEQPCEHFTCLIISNNSASFVAPTFELDSLLPESKELVQTIGWSSRVDPFDCTIKLLPSTPSTIAVGRNVASWMLLPLMDRLSNCRFISAGKLMEDMRIIKSKEEQRILQDVQHRSGRAFLSLIEHGVCGMSERDVVHLFVKYSFLEGIDSKGPMVASGPNTALAHHHPNDRIICPGDTVFIDFGGADIKSRYRADTTRTFAVKHASSELKELYEIVLEANKAAFIATQPGALCCEIDNAGRTVIEKAGYGQFFTHSLGHGIGLDMHEAPFIGALQSDSIASGQVFSIEPGIYIPGRIGIRTEDIVLVHNDYPERLTNLSHELMVVD